MFRVVGTSQQLLVSSEKLRKFLRGSQLNIEAFVFDSYPQIIVISSDNGSVLSSVQNSSFHIVSLSKTA